MKLHYILLILFLNISPLFSQVGINTTNPSPASVLDVNSSSDGVSFGGLMPPKVTAVERDQIPVTPADDGLLVYVTNGINRYLQIYDGVDGVWRTIYPTFFELSTVLAGWDLNGIVGFDPIPLAATISSPSVIVGGLTRGAGVTTTGTSASDAWGGNGFESTTFADAITANKFITFTMTPAFGVNISFTGIDAYNIRCSVTGPTTGIWQYSIDAISFIDIGPPITWGGINSAAGNPQPGIDLSGIIELQNLTSTSTVTFRIVNWGASAAGGTWYINQVGAGNDLILRGNIK